MLPLRSALGLLLLAGVAWLFSENRRKVPWQTVAVGLGLQVVLGAVLILNPAAARFFLVLNRQVLVVSEATVAGTAMVFGYLATQEPPFAASNPGNYFIMALQALPLILVVSALSALLFYWRVLPLLVRAFSWLLQKTLRVSGCEGVAAAAAVDQVDIRSEAKGSLDAIVRGTTDGVQILINVVAMMIVAIAFIFMIDAVLGLLPTVNGQPLRFQRILGWGMAPLVWMIGRLYPLFGVLLLCMTFGVLGGLLLSDHPVLPNLAFNPGQHPGGLPVWPLLFITLSCGAISGFHSTQSPIMARCIRSEKSGRLVFYGAMVAEGIIALIWATVGMSFYESPEALNAVIAKGTPALVVSEACRGLPGPVGAVLAILGVIVLPVTSGDTAFRATRLILAETFKVDQTRSLKRLCIAVPLFLIAIAISTRDFNLIWRYFGWSNQALASLMLWAAAIYLAKAHKAHRIASLPATFMTAVVIAFILQADIGFGLAPKAANITGVVGALIALATLIIRHRAMATSRETFV